MEIKIEEVSNVQGYNHWDGEHRITVVSAEKPSDEFKGRMTQVIQTLLYRPGFGPGVYRQTVERLLYDHDAETGTHVFRAFTYTSGSD